MKAFLKIFIVSAVISVVNGCVVLSAEENKKVEDIHNLACSTPAVKRSPWHIQNLYDCENRLFYVPYQLWTGTTWDGEKDGPCLHKADSYFNVNGDSRTTIKGPKPWKNPETGKEEMVWVRDKIDGSKTQYFTCHEKGIGRVYDSRRPKYYRSGRCKFPAGYGWELFSRRYCGTTSIEIVDISIDENHHLQDLKFKWWIGSTLDHIYRYVPNQGMTNAWKQ